MKVIPRGESAYRWKCEDRRLCPFNFLCCDFTLWCGFFLFEDLNHVLFTPAFLLWLDLPCEAQELVLMTNPDSNIMSQIDRNFPILYF